jgi:WD40 repeat protein
MLAGITPGGDVRAIQELLAANAIEANGVPILNTQIARFTTQKIIDPGSRPTALAYRPGGHIILTGQRNGTLRRWDSATGKPVGSAMVGHSKTVRSVAYAPDGHTVASVGDDGTMRLWNADTGTALTPNPVHVGQQTSVTFSPHGKIFTGGLDDRVYEWDTSAHLIAAQQVFDDPTEHVNNVLFDRSGNLFAATGDKGGVAIYDTHPFKLHAPIIHLHGPASAPVTVQCIAFSPDGHTIAAGSANLQLWNIDGPTLLRTVPLGTSLLAGMDSVAYSPDGRRIATGRTDGAVQLWDPDTGTQLGQTMIGHTGRMDGLSFNSDGRQIATINQDGTLRLWSVTIGQPMRGPDTFVGKVAFSPDGKRVAASGDTAVQRWEVDSGQPLPPLIPTLALAGTGAGFSYVDGGRILTAADDGTVQMWDANTGQPTGPPIRIAIQPGDFQFAFTGDGRRLASGNFDDATIQEWDVGTGRALGQPMTIARSRSYLYALAFSPDGHRLVAGYTDGLRVWNTDTTRPDGIDMIDKTAPFGAVAGVAFSRDGSTVAAATLDGSVQLWDFHTRKQLPDSPLRHTGQTITVAFGVAHQLASGGGVDGLRLWDAATGQPTAAPQPGSNALTSVAVSPDGRLAAWATADGNVQLSPAIVDPAQLCDKLPFNMSHKQWRDWVSPGIGYITLCHGLPVAPD